MEKITAVIIDDQQPCIDTLSLDLASYSFIDLVATSTSCEKGRDMVLSKQPDILFIDVEMPDKSGLEFIHEIQPYLHTGIYIVFYSAFEKYMIDALRISAFDYLLKPYTKEELDMVIMRIKNVKKIDPKTIWNSLSSLLAESRKIAIQGVSQTILVYVSDIVCVFFSKENHCWDILLSDNTRHPLKKNITSKSLLTLSKSLIQISPDCILNTRYLVSIENQTLLCLLVPPFQNLHLTISRRAYSKIRGEVNVL